MNCFWFSSLFFFRHVFLVLPEAALPPLYKRQLLLCIVLYCTVYCTVQCTVLYSVLYSVLYCKVYSLMQDWFFQDKKWLFMLILFYGTSPLSRSLVHLFSVIFINKIFWRSPFNQCRFLASQDCFLLWKITIFSWYNWMMTILFFSFRIVQTLGFHFTHCLLNILNSGVCVLLLSRYFVLRFSVQANAVQNVHSILHAPTFPHIIFYVHSFLWNTLRWLIKMLPVQVSQ